MRLWVIPDHEKEDNPQSMEIVLQDEKRSYSILDELLSRDVKGKTIAQLVKCLHEGNSWIYATIVHIEMENGWSYMGCKRYKLQVRVMDGTDFISLLLWDREATKLIGKSATQLKGQIDETTDSNNDGAYLVELDTILDKNALFKVAVKSYNVEQPVEVYTVLKICDDEELTKQFKPSSRDDDSPEEASTTRSASYSWYKTMISDSDYAEFKNFSKWLGVSQ
ncbi:hypothetical protein BC332_01021 [Capsicum chinense]|nr:hypothetical protein BC332_01021 [Capsicum chinense]